MGQNNNDIITLLSSKFLSGLNNPQNIKIAEFDAIVTLLIKADIPFDVEYSPGTRRDAAAAQLTIYINPTTTLNLTFSFQSGSNIFTST